MRKTIVLGLVLAVGGMAVAETPGTRPGATTSPSLKEMAKKIRKIADDRTGAVKVAHFDLSSAVVEKPSDFSLLGSVGTPLQELLARIHRAKDDKDIAAVLVTVGEPKTNLAMSQEIRDALAEVGAAGKKVFVYADGYDVDSYTLASGATDVCLLPGGEILMPGVGIETMYLKGTFDKLGVQADYVQIGAYKGADEEFTRTGSSKEFNGELNKLMDGLYDQVIGGIAEHRKLTKSAVRGIIDDSLLTADAAKDRGLVDHLVDVDGLKELIGDELGDNVELVPDYGAEAPDKLDLSSPFSILAMLAKKSAVSTKPAVAVVYADGVIVDGPGGASLMDGYTVGAENIREAMREVARDDSIKAVVIRINSPGGSALASEAMWQAVRRVAKTRPVVISVGSMAASGGYYLACAGDHIFADPGAIVGSIGVVGGKFVVKDLYEKLGISTEIFSRGKNAELFSSTVEFSPKQREMVKQWMTATYDQFTQRVMTTRAGKIAKIEDVAQGRIFPAVMAKSLGMVDELGGIDAALGYAAHEGHLETGKFAVRVVPAPKTLADLLTGDKPTLSAVNLPKVESPLLSLMPAGDRQMLGLQIEILHLLQQRPLVLAAPFVINGQ